MAVVDVVLFGPRFETKISSFVFVKADAFPSSVCNQSIAYASHHQWLSFVVTTTFKGQNFSSRIKRVPYMLIFRISWVE